MKSVKKEESVDSQRFAIEDALNTYFYVVPDYQREYIWKKDDVEQLLKDINEQIGENPSEYFIGMVLVTPTKGKNKDRLIVIDGQQRLTTMFLILCALRVHFRSKGMAEYEDLMNQLIFTGHTNKGIKTNLKLVPCYKNANKVLDTLVKTSDAPKQVRKDIKSAKIPIRGSVKSILDAYDVIYNFLTEHYSDAAKLEEYWEHLAKKVVFIQISTNNVGNALRIFETINDRGVGLDSMDLLKNLLFRQVSDKKFPMLKDRWKKITDQLEESKERPLRFLRYFLMANYDIKKGLIIRENKIYDWISTHDALTKHKENPFPFVKKIKRNAGYYIKFSAGYGNDGKPNLAMESLRKLTGKPFHLHYILLLAAIDLPKSLFDHFVSQLENFLFYYIFTKSLTNELERNFPIWAKKVREITQEENPRKQRKELNGFIKDNFEPDMQNKRQALEDALNRLTLDTQNRTRYLLARFTQHVDMEFRGRKACKSFSYYYEELEIEHILPKTPSVALLSTWKTSWKKAHPEDENPEQSYDKHKNRLGNLTLLEKPLNRSAGNDFFSKKKPKYAESGNYLTKSLSGLSESTQNSSITSINEHLCAPVEWDAKAIVDRQKKLSKLALEIWKTADIK